MTDHDTVSSFGHFVSVSRLTSTTLSVDGILVERRRLEPFLVLLTMCTGSLQDYDIDSALDDSKEEDDNCLRSGLALRIAALAKSLSLFVVMSSGRCVNLALVWNRQNVHRVASYVRLHMIVVCIDGTTSIRKLCLYYIFNHTIMS